MPLIKKSEALYKFAGLRFWSEDEIELREMFQKKIISVVRRTLLDLNPAWTFHRMEGPILTPREHISPAYSDKDLFITNHEVGGDVLLLRAETTASSFVYARKHCPKYPVCVYQSGKSFRRELNNGASAAKLRFNEFHQLEFQCIYANNTKADYREALITAISPTISWFLSRGTRVVDSDRLPSYSESTKDIEAVFENDWKEVASCSIRKDYSEETRVCEIAIGLDRIVELTPKR